jgi:hypothetical protein
MTCFRNKRKTHAVGPRVVHTCGCACPRAPGPGPAPPPRPPPGPAPEPRLSPHIRHALCTQSHRHTLTQAVHRPLRRHTHRARSSALPAPPCGPHTTAGEREGDPGDSVILLLGWHPTASSVNTLRRLCARLSLLPLTPLTPTCNSHSHTHMHVHVHVHAHVRATTRLVC